MVDIAPILERETMNWAIGLAIGFPLAMVVLGELILRLRRAGRPIARTLGHVRTLVLPLAAAYVLVVHVVGIRADDVLARVVLTGLWIAINHTVLAFGDDVLFGGAEAGTWQARMPRLFIDLARFLLVLLGAAIVLSTVWGLNLQQLVAALGVGSLVLGLALQEPLGNVFSGVMLMFERPLAPGDWISVDGVTGRVVEMNWRAVHLETPTLEVLVVPNAVLSKGKFSNYSRETRRHVEVLSIGFAHEDAPNRVKRLLVVAAGETPGVLAEPGPSAALAEYQDGKILYKLTFAVDDYGQAGGVRDDLHTRIWYASRREGLAIIAPAPTRPRPDPVALLAGFPQLGIKDPTALEGLSSRLAVRVYGRGEDAVVAGERLPGLHLVLSGHASLSIVDAGGNRREVARVGRGEFFGETAAFSGDPSDVTVTAIDDLEAIFLDSEALQAVLDRTPRLARDIGAVMDVRRKAAQSARAIRNGRG